jgi:Ca-activated chloride channel family protein
VLLTDGENNKGLSYDEFRRRFLELQAETNIAKNNMEVRTFPILFGEASSDELEEIAHMTGGRAFDGRHTNLGSVFKEIRGYQ